MEAADFKLKRDVTWSGSHRETCHTAAEHCETFDSSAPVAGVGVAAIPNATTLLRLLIIYKTGP